LFTKNILDGKVALVTGASRGIGRGIALALADAGTDVIVHYARKTALAIEVVEEIESKGRRAAAVRANFAEKEKIEAMLDYVEDVFGGCDIFIANAARAGSARCLRPATSIGIGRWMSMRVPFCIAFNDSRHIWSVRVGGAWSQ
jgi:enoyl-[acyl-carrier protein] reductase III